MSAEHPISVRELNHWFGNGEARKQAVFDVNLDIEQGSLTVLMGPSGSGKTTLLTLMACLRNVQEGSVIVLNRELNAADPDTKTALRHELGFIFQAHNLHASLTAMQNVQMGLQVFGRGQREKQHAAAAHILTALGLGDRLHYPPDSLSGGQKQRVAIARALVANPRIVFADEPTAALDKDSGQRIVEMLKRLGKERKTTTIMVTHDNRILDLADRVLVMEDGRLVGSG
jgi:putative ABC transport system ATP-binding protein